MIENLRKASDDEVDSVYMGQQAAAHDEALNLHKSYASRGDYPKLTTLAAEPAKIIEHHRDMIAKVQAVKTRHQSRLTITVKVLSRSPLPSGGHPLHLSPVMTPPCSTPHKGQSRD